MGSLWNCTLHPQETLMLIYIFIFSCGNQRNWILFSLWSWSLATKPPKNKVHLRSWAVNPPVCHQKLPQFHPEGAFTTQEEQWGGIREIYWCVCVKQRKHRPWGPLRILGLSILKASMDFYLCVKNIVNPWGNLVPGINECNTQVPNNGKWDWWVGLVKSAQQLILLPQQACQ